MHRRSSTFGLIAALAATVALAAPGTALGAGASLTGPATVQEGAGKATYEFNCGDVPNPLSTELLPLPPIPNTGAVSVSVAPATTAPAQAADYGEPSRTTIACGDPSLTQPVKIDVPIVDDALDEPAERLKVTVEGALAPEGQIAKAVETAIADNDVPAVSIVEFVRVLEGGTAEFAVTLDQDPVEPATINYATENSTAAAGSDYTATSGALAFGSGQRTGKIAIPILDDAAPEGVEGFFLNLTSADKATLGTKRQGVVAVFDNDKAAAPAISIRPVGVVEGNSGVVNALFTVVLSSAPAERVQVKWKTANKTANLADYASGSGTLSFDAGQTSRTISVNVKGDVRDERAETFTVLLSNPTGATLAAASALGTIADDDGPKVGIGKPKLGRKATKVAVSCPASAEGCAGTLSAKAGKLKLGRAAFELAPGATRTVKLKLSKRARRALSRRSLRATFTAAAADPSGGARSVTRKYRLRRAR